MLPLDGGSKIHSWMAVAKMLTTFYLVLVTPLGINHGHSLSFNFQIFLALCKCGTKHSDVFLAKNPFCNSRTKETQYSLKSRV